MKGSLFARRRIRVDVSSIDNKSSAAAAAAGSRGGGDDGDRPWSNTFGARKKLRHKQPLGPPPAGAGRLGRLLDVLERHAVFQGCERRLLRAAVERMELALIEPGQTVYSAGDKADYLYVVEAGELDVMAPSPDGDSPRSTLRVYTGDIVGDVALTYASRREFALQACSRGAKCWAMRRRWFERLAGPVVFEKRRLVRRFTSDVPILASLPVRELALLAEAMREALYDPGDVIIAQGDEPDYFFILEEGAATATARITDVAEPLEVVGESPVTCTCSNVGQLSSDPPRAALEGPRAPRLAG